MCFYTLAFLSGYRVVVFPTVVVKIFSSMLPNGERVADAYVERISAKACRVMVFKNNKWYNISSSSVDDMGIAKKIANWLVGWYYL